MYKESNKLYGSLKQIYKFQQVFFFAADDAVKKNTKYVSVMKKSSFVIQLYGKMKTMTIIKCQTASLRRKQNTK